MSRSHNSSWNAVLLTVLLAGLGVPFTRSADGAPALNPAEVQPVAVTEAGQPQTVYRIGEPIKVKLIYHGGQADWDGKVVYNAKSQVARKWNSAVLGVWAADNAEVPAREGQLEVIKADESFNEPFQTGIDIAAVFSLDKPGRYELRFGSRKTVAAWSFTLEAPKTSVDEKIKTGRVVESQPAKLGHMNLSTFISASAILPTTDRSTPLTVGVRVTNVSEQEIQFRPDRITLMLKWGDGPLSIVGINNNGMPRPAEPIPLKAGQDWTWTVDRAAIAYIGNPKYLAFIGQACQGGIFEHALKGKARSIGIAARYEGARPERVPCGPAVCAISAPVARVDSGYNAQLAADKTPAPKPRVDPKQEALAKQAITLAQDQLARARQAFEAGTATRGEVEAAECELLRAKIRLELLGTSQEQRPQLQKQLAQVNVSEAQSRLVSARALFEKAMATQAEVESAEHDLLRAKVRLELAGADAETAAKLHMKLAEIDVAAAQIQLTRLKKRFDQGATTRDELEQAESTLIKARQKLEAMRIPEKGAAVPAALPVSIRIVTGQTLDDAPVHPADPWISGRLATVGVPQAQATSEWIAVTHEEQEIYASMMGGRLIKGRFRREDGKVSVRLTGFKIGPTPRDIELPDRPGEGAVVKLTDYPPPRNVFAAVRVGQGPRVP